MEETKKKNGCMKWALIILGVFILLIILGNIFGDSEQTSQDGEKANDTVAVAATEDKVEDENKNDKDLITWHYESSTDEMTDTKNVWASLKSDNYIEQEFPYEGDTYATIIIRYMKRYGTDVILKIDMGQIVGLDINTSNYVTARFDDAEPKKYYFDDAADMSTEQVFLRNAKDFINRCKSAKVIKIDIPMFQAGKPVFTFHVDKPLEWSD